jgi:hypothetical protein
LVIIIIIIATWLLGCLVGKRCLQTSALLHGMMGTFVDRAWAIHELGEVGFIGTCWVFNAHQKRFASAWIPM